MNDVSTKTGWQRWLSLALLAIAFFSLLALPFIYRPARSTTAPDNTNKTAGRKLVILTPHWEGIRREFQRAFSDWTMRNHGYQTDIEWLDMGGTQDDIRYVKSEFKRSPSGINIDIFFGGGIEPYIQFKKMDLLQPVNVPAPVLSRIPAQFNGVEMYDKDLNWFGACLGGFGIIYNKKVMGLKDIPIPETWQDISRPQYFTWVGSGDPRSSGSVHMIYEIILQAYGWEKGWEIIVKFAGNIRNFSRSGSDVPKDTALGEVACGLAIDVYALRQIAEAGKDKIGFVLPENVTVINPDGIAVLKGAPNEPTAKLFIEFILSEEGQKLWFLKKGIPGGPTAYALSRMPVIPGLLDKYGDKATIELDAFKWKSGFKYDSEKGSARIGILNTLLGASILDTHDQLISAWTRLKDMPDNDPRIKELVKPLITEEECMDLISGTWTNSENQARLKMEWTNKASEKYKKLSGR